MKRRRARMHGTVLDEASVKENELPEDDNETVPTDATANDTNVPEEGSPPLKKRSISHNEGEQQSEDNNQNKESHEDSDTEDEVPLVTKTITKPEELLDKLSVTLDEAKNYFFELKQRHENLIATDEWLQIRRYRLTASRFYRAVGPDPIQQQAMVRTLGTWPLPEADPHAGSRSGIRLEGRAREAYERVTKTSVKEVGIVISPEIPYLAGSPDGLVEMASGKRILLEIKTFLIPGKGTIEERFKQKPEIKAQVMGAIALVRDILPDISSCDVFFWSPSKCETIRIHYDEKYWKQLHKRLRYFYFTSFLTMWMGWTAVCRDNEIDDLPFMDYLHVKKYRSHRQKSKKDFMITFSESDDELEEKNDE